MHTYLKLQISEILSNLVAIYEFKFKINFYMYINFVMTLIKLS